MCRVSHLSPRPLALLGVGTRDHSSSHHQQRSQVPAGRTALILANQESPNSNQTNQRWPCQRKTPSTDPSSVSWEQLLRSFSAVSLQIPTSLRNQFFLRRWHGTRLQPVPGHVSRIEAASSDDEGQGVCDCGTSSCSSRWIISCHVARDR